MAPEEVAVASDEEMDDWLQYLRTTGPRVDDEVPRWIAELLAGDPDPGASLLAGTAMLTLARDAMAIAEVIRERVERRFTLHWPS